MNLYIYIYNIIGLFDLTEQGNGDMIMTLLIIIDWIIADNQEYRYVITC